MVSLLMLCIQVFWLIYFVISLYVMVGVSATIYKNRKRLFQPDIMEIIIQGPFLKYLCLWLSASFFLGPYRFYSPSRNIR